MERRVPPHDVGQDVVVDDHLLGVRGLEALGQGARAGEFGAVEQDDQVVLGERLPLVGAVRDVVREVAVARLRQIGVQDVNGLAARLEQPGEGRLGTDAVPVRTDVPGEDHTGCSGQDLEGGDLLVGENGMEGRVHGGRQLYCPTSPRRHSGSRNPMAGRPGWPELRERRA